jgi:hypothetical protein
MVRSGGVVRRLQWTRAGLGVFMAAMLSAEVWHRHGLMPMQHGLLPL